MIDGLMSCEKKPKEVIETTFFYENAIENVQKFVDHMKTPAAVVCATDRIAFGVYKVMSEKRYTDTGRSIRGRIWRLRSRRTVTAATYDSKI